MVSPTPIRFPADLGHAVTEAARRAHVSKSQMVIRAVDEWLRMQQHPRVTFVTTNTGARRATLMCGPQVWVVAESWMQHPEDERTVEAVADAIGIAVADANAALEYWAAYRDEIDEQIGDHQADQDAALAQWEQRQALRAL